MGFKANRQYHRQCPHGTGGIVEDLDLSFRIDDAQDGAASAVHVCGVPVAELLHKMCQLLEGHSFAESELSAVGRRQIQMSAVPIHAAVGAVPSGLRTVVLGRQIALSWVGSAYAQNYNVKRSTVSGGPYATIALTKSTDFIDSGLTPKTVYYYVVSANTPDGETDTSAQVSVKADPQLWGIIIGTDSSYKNLGAGKEAAFDGSLKNFFDASENTAWVGLDFGEGRRARIQEVKYCPRSGFSQRMVGGKFQGSDTPDFGRGVVDLFTIQTQPPQGVLSSQSISNPHWFRYVRYLSPAGGYGNVAEVQFFGDLKILDAPDGEEP